MLHFCEMEVTIMAESKIPEGKSRYYLTLTKETVETVKDDLLFLGLHRSTFSSLMDELLSKTAPVIHLLAEKKRSGETVSFHEVYALMLAQMAVEENAE